MQVDGIFNNTIQLLGKHIDLRSKNQNLISSNIANAETPGYIPKTLDFEEQLQSALKSSKKGGATSATLTNSRHIPLKSSSASIDSVKGKIVETPAKTPGKDGNAVELENEMSRMLENQVMYNATVQMLSKKFEGLRIAVREGK